MTLRAAGKCLLGYPSFEPGNSNSDGDQRWSGGIAVQFSALEGEVCDYGNSWETTSRQRAGKLKFEPVSTDFDRFAL